MSRVHAVVQLLPRAVNGVGAGPAAEVSRRGMTAQECLQCVADYLSDMALIENGACLIVTIQREQIRPES